MSDKKTIALVTGASSGIGEEFCRQLASRCDLIIATGRRSRQLEALASSLQATTEVFPLVADLTTVEGRTRVIETLRQKGPLDYLVNNAGFSTLGTFESLELGPQQEMVSVHIDATMALCRAAIPFMRENGGGNIINVSSLVAFNPYASVAVYGATKAFLNHFSEALQLELEGSGIRVQSLCPGFTRTDFHGRGSMDGFDPEQVPEALWMSSEQVVTLSLRELPQGPVVLVAGESNLAMARQGLEGQLQRLS